MKLICFKTKNIVKSLIDFQVYILIPMQYYLEHTFPWHPIICLSVRLKPTRFLMYSPKCQHYARSKLKYFAILKNKGVSQNKMLFSQNSRFFCKKNVSKKDIFIVLYYCRNSFEVTEQGNANYIIMDVCVQKWIRVPKVNHLKVHLQRTPLKGYMHLFKT